ncbi:hypothetical protein [Kitasatospora sp. NPDC059327]|uniref:hypothetical protein n=1 Tax=Kitasatospora sp. NPDC059327 TaxID=3346803 RepID=UPI0036B529F5
MSGLAPSPAGVLLPARLGRTPGEAVARLAEERVTGILRGPAGAVYFADGLVAHAESDRSPDLAALLTGCGRIAPEVWQDAVRTFGPHCRVGGALVEQGRITRGELEICHLGALFDAAFFVLDGAGAAAWTAAAWASGVLEASGAVGGGVGAAGAVGPSSVGCWAFEPGVRHWLGPVTAVSAFRLCREIDRRRRLLERIWPWPELDTAPVRPVAARAVGGIGGAEGADAREARACGVLRTARRRQPSRHQRELLDHADGRRTPAELARLLGRSAFATTADVRRLAAAGLLATPGRAVPRHAAQAPAGSDRGTGAPAPAGHVSGGQAPAARVPTGSVPAARSGSDVVPIGRTGSGLHRRVPGAALAGLVPASAVRSAHPPTPAHPPTAAAAHPLTVPDPDIALLTRVRTLLEARL